MKRLFAVACVGLGAFLALSTQSACSSTLSQPFENLKSQPITIHRLQNYEPPQAQAAGAAPPAGPLQLPPQIQQWLNGAAAALPQGLIPPGLLPGSAAPTTTDGPRFYNFRILGTMSVSDTKMHDEILEIFGKEASFGLGAYAVTPLLASTQRPRAFSRSRMPSPSTM